MALRQITIREIWIKLVKQPNGNSETTVTELPFSHATNLICRMLFQRLFCYQIAIWTLKLKLKCKRNLRHIECTHIYEYDNKNAFQ